MIIILKKHAKMYNIYSVLSNQYVFIFLQYLKERKHQKYKYRKKNCISTLSCFVSHVNIVSVKFTYIISAMLVYYIIVNIRGVAQKRPKTVTCVYRHLIYFVEL